MEQPLRRKSDAPARRARLRGELVFGAIFGIACLLFALAVAAAALWLLIEEHPARAHPHHPPPSESRPRELGDRPADLSASRIVVRTDRTERVHRREREHLLEGPTRELDGVVNLDGLADAPSTPTVEGILASATGLLHQDPPVLPIDAGAVGLPPGI